MLMSWQARSLVAKSRSETARGEHEDNTVPAASESWRV